MKESTHIEEKRSALAEHLCMDLEDSQIETTGNNYFTVPTMYGWRRYMILTNDEANEKMVEELGWRLHELHWAILLPHIGGITDGLLCKVLTLFDDGFVDSVEAVNGVILGLLGNNYENLVEKVKVSHGRGHFISVDDKERLSEGYYIYKKVTREGGR